MIYGVRYISVQKCRLILFCSQAKLQKFLPTRILKSYSYVALINLVILVNSVSNFGNAYRSQRHILLVLWSIFMSILTLMAFTVPDHLRETSFSFLTFFNASGPIQPQYLPYWRGSYGQVKLVFGSFHLFLSLWMFLEYIIVNWPNFKLPRLYYAFITR